jgi:hypothetical protein
MGTWAETMRSRGPRAALEGVFFRAKPVSRKTFDLQLSAGGGKLPPLGYRGL